ncbi:DUF6301 family protein [uncultured Actinomyces sp.]|uniref:DUF6301 family protein n=1 Tax=uncultured Actinomyces sp. TaxID=249061 RepID=UPI0026384D52|nr:DUF6301 family protein [uncultured Actinomyces sp.]
MSTSPGILDYSQQVGLPFYAYTTEQMVNIVRTWAEHTWPITLSEAFALRDQCGWTPAPDDGRFFTTPVSNGEEDGVVRRETRNRDLISGIDVQLTTRAPVDLKPQVSAVTQSIYTSYRDALSRIYGPPKDSIDSTGPYSDWRLVTNVSVNLSSVGTFTNVVINSPAETESIALGAYHEDKYGPDVP